MREIKQRDIVLVDLDPVVGHEQNGKRPVVIVSGSDFVFSKLVMVCPITSNIKHRAGYVILEKNKVNNLDSQSEILVSHIRTISLDRVVKRIGEITEEELQEVFGNLDLLLDK